MHSITQSAPSFYLLPIEIGKRFRPRGFYGNSLCKLLLSSTLQFASKKSGGLLDFKRIRPVSFVVRYRYQPASDDAKGGDESDSEIRFGDAVSSFNCRDFYKCHDLLEAMWMEAEEPSKTLIHGLLQCAVGFYHLFDQVIRSHPITIEIVETFIFYPQNHKGAMMELGEGLCKLGKLGFDDGPFHQFEADIAAVLEFIYETQIELAACTEDLCVTMDRSESSYKLLGRYGSGQLLYRLQDDGDGDTYILFGPHSSSLMCAELKKVKLPLLAATEEHLAAVN